MPEEEDQDPIRDSRSEDDTLTVELAGDLDSAAVPRLRDRLLGLLDEHHPRHVKVDMDGVERIHSGALAVLIEVQRVLEQGGRVSLHNLPERAAGLVEVMRLEAVLDLPEAESQTGEAQPEEQA
ncbi:MAG: STAS domain-containing protein [Phycisphaeraceae bacterium]